jgi:hypothetical protein
MSITINLEWSAHMKMIVKTKCDKNILITGIITVEISLQYMKFNYLTNRQFCVFMKTNYMYDTLINITYIICFFLPIKIYSITSSPLFTCLRELSLWTTPLHASHPTGHPEKAMPLCSSSTRDHCKSLSLLCNASHTTSAYTALCDSVM